MITLSGFVEEIYLKIGHNKDAMSAVHVDTFFNRKILCERVRALLHDRSSNRTIRT
jgi:hypothetical protein